MRIIKRSTLFLIFAGLIVTSTLLEIPQIWMPGRLFSFLDILYNILGLILGFGAWKMLVGTDALDTEDAEH